MYAIRGPNLKGIECLREAIHATEGRYADKNAKGTKRHHDHGSQFILHAFQGAFKTLGTGRARPSSASPIAMDLSSDSSGP